jgi:hypothetical protein
MRLVQLAVAPVALSLWIAACGITLQVGTVDGDAGAGTSSSSGATIGDGSPSASSSSGSSSGVVFSSSSSSSGAPCTTRVARDLACENVVCGKASDGCGGTWDCDDTCKTTRGDNAMCEPGTNGCTCAQNTCNLQCGQIADGCGGMANCGTPDGSCQRVSFNDYDCNADHQCVCRPNDDNAACQLVYAGGDGCGYTTDGCDDVFDVKCGCQTGTCLKSGGGKTFCAPADFCNTHCGTFPNLIGPDLTCGNCPPQHRASW